MLRSVDLFAGIGGFRLAADRLSFKVKTVASVEIDPRCRQLYRAVLAKEDLDELAIEDVCSIFASESKHGPGRAKLPSFDLLMAGFPCQAFSNIGLRGGMEDPRGQLFFRILDILVHYKPTYFVLENVQKLSTIGRGSLLKEVVSHLEGAGYHVHLWDLHADRYGLPQQRRRLFFCGVSKRYSRAKALLSAPPEVPRELWRYPTSWHLLERAMPPRHIVPLGTRKVILRRNPKWMGDLVVNRAIARPITATMHKWHRANQDNYYTDAYVMAERPDVAVGINPDQVGDAPLRRITPLEGFRFQGFPDSFAKASDELSLPLATQYRMIGNAVPVDLAHSVLKHFLESYQ